jgi:hypothetical protein
MAGFGDQPTPQPLSDPKSAHPGAFLWPRREDIAGNRWARQLPQPGSLHVFREPVHTGKVGRPKLVLAAGVMIARVIKRHERRRVVEVLRRVVVGREAEVISRVIGTQRVLYKR